MLYGPDSFGYEAEAVPYEFEDISATGTVELLDVDDSSFALTAADLSGFEFEFYGVEYTTGINPSSNGLITFGSGNSEYSNEDFTTIPPQAAIAPLWDDLVTYNGGGVYWQVLGSGGDQRLVIQWDDVFYIGGSQSNPITFQAVLYERTGDIQFNYADLGDNSTSQNEGASATIGIKASGPQGGDRLVPSYDAGPNGFVGSARSTRFAFRDPVVFGLDVATDDIVQLNFDTGQEVSRFSLPQGGAVFNDAIAFSGDRVFYYGFDGTARSLQEFSTAGTLLDTDPIASLGLPVTIDGLALHDALLVASDSTTGRVYFVNTTTDTLVRSWLSPVGLGEGLAGAGERGSLFVADSAADTITELDADTGEVVRVLSLPMVGPAGLAYVESELIVSSPFGELRRLNPDTGQVLGAVNTGLQLSALGGDDATTPAPRVLSSSISDGDTVGPGTIVYSAQFSRPLNAGVLDASDVLLVGASTGEQPIDSLSYNAQTQTLTLTLGVLFEDQYTLTLLSAADAFVGVGGRPLDGEAAPGTSVPSGNRVEGGDFSVHFSADVDVAPLPSPFEPVAPLGSQVYRYTVHGNVSSTSDLDGFSLAIDPNQDLTLVLEGAPGLVMFFSPSGGGGDGGGFLQEVGLA
ncbi:MAG: hypothetical protein KDA37_13585 [Planctomycetales bacterium]|nr:hypothetical protein [Planctomycetales bacterium]